MKAIKKSKPRVSDLQPKKGKSVNGGLNFVKYVDKSSPK